MSILAGIIQINLLEKMNLFTLICAGIGIAVLLIIFALGLITLIENILR